MSAPMTAQPAGCSGTLLAKKLGLAENGCVFAKGVPAGVAFEPN